MQKNKIILQRFEMRFYDIARGKEPSRSNRLATLMSDMEKVFHIPMIRRPEWVEQNQDVMDLYLKVSMARNLEEVR